MSTFDHALGLEDEFPTVDQMLAAIGWGVDVHEDATPYAVDLRSGAVRISDRWGPEWKPGVWRCGPRGPGGSFGSFDHAVEAAYRHHVLGEPEPIRVGVDLIAVWTHAIAEAAVPRQLWPGPPPSRDAETGCRRET